MPLLIETWQKIRINLLFDLFFTVVPSNVVCFFPGGLLSLMTFSRGLVGVEDVENVILMTKDKNNLNTGAK